MSDKPKKKGPGGRPTKYRPEMCEQVIEIGKEGASLVEISCRIGITNETLLQWRKSKPEFSVAIKEAQRQSQSWWEARGREAAFGGHDGFNASAFIFQMKNRFREDWRDKHEIDQNVTGDITITIGSDSD